MNAAARIADAGLEANIAVTSTRLKAAMRAHDVPLAKALQAPLYEQINRRSPEAVERMERARGLRA